MRKQPINTFNFVWRLKILYKQYLICYVKWIVFLILSICAFAKGAFAQNLVPNPSFEEGTPACQPVIFSGDFPTLARYWNAPTSGTSDLYSTIGLSAGCFSAMPYSGQDNSIDAQHIGSQLPRTGNRFAGIYTFTVDPNFPSYREYLQAKLVEPLEVGQTYCLRFYVSHADFSKYASPISAYIGSYLPFQSVGGSVIPVTPKITSGGIITDSDNWSEVSGTFVADSPADAIVIGNFLNDSQSPSLMVNNPTIKYPLVAYYFIDDVSVQKVSGGIAIHGDTVVCHNSTIHLSILGDFDEITWSTFNDSTRILSNSSHMTIIHSGKVKYKVKAKRCGLTFHDTLTVNTFEFVSPELGPDATLCKDAIVTFDAGENRKQIRWQDGSPERFYVATQGGNYFVSVVDQYNCTFRDDVKIQYRNPPTAKLGPDTLICSSFPLLKGFDGDSYLWSDGSTDESFLPTSSGFYWVKITNQCGSSVDTVQIFSMNDLFIPNVITVNSDRLNDQFKVSGIGRSYQVSLKIISRDGSEIFSSNDYQNDWPSPNQIPESGTYYYLMSFLTCRNYKGIIQVLR